MTRFLRSPPWRQRAWTSRACQTRRRTPVEGATFPRLRRGPAAQTPAIAFAGDCAASEGGWLRRRKERALFADRQRPAAAEPPTQPAGQGPGRDLSPRHGPGRRAVQGRRGPVGQLLRDAPRVLALDRGLDRRGPEHRIAGARAGAPLRRHRRHPAAGGVRSAEADRDPLGPRRSGHRVGLGVRLRGHPAGLGGRGAGAPGRRSRAGHQPRQLGQTLLLQIAHVRQRSRHGAAVDGLVVRPQYARHRAQRQDAGDPARRGAPAAAPTQIRSPQPGAALPGRGRVRAPSWCTRASRTRCRPSRSVWSARCTYTPIG